MFFFMRHTRLPAELVNQPLSPGGEPLPGWLMRNEFERTARCKLLQEVHRLCEAFLLLAAQLGGYPLRGGVLSKLRLRETRFGAARQSCTFATQMNYRHWLTLSPVGSLNCSADNRAQLRILGLLNDKGKQVYRLPNIPLTSQNNLSTVILNFSVTAPGI